MISELLSFLAVLAFSIAGIIHFFLQLVPRVRGYMAISAARISNNKKAAMLIEQKELVSLSFWPLVGCIAILLGLTFWFFKFSQLWPILLQLF